ncbi:b(0,+)-type amino acid transporter 1-like [Pecten maximus]|uniref:b(0,+)-type amino acid transporter 1-like n=1 Tax=Pecten maximus TaxID=6579 RepID=UPI00145852E6|nr:b(0,+)-type amino acid transporter 1-like [Pecten maximus]
MLALVFIMISNIRSLITFFSFAAWLFYGLTVLALLVLRFTMREVHRPIKIFILLPVVFMAFSMYLVVIPIVQNPTSEFLYACAFIFGGLVIYVPFVHFRVDRGCCKPVTRSIQCLMEVVPSLYDLDDVSGYQP